MRRGRWCTPVRPPATCLHTPLTSAPRHSSSLASSPLPVSIALLRPTSLPFPRLIARPTSCRSNREAEHEWYRLLGEAGLTEHEADDDSYCHFTIVGVRSVHAAGSASWDDDARSHKNQRKTARTVI